MLRDPIRDPLDRSPGAGQIRVPMRRYEQRMAVQRKFGKVESARTIHRALDTRNCRDLRIYPILRYR
jgi:hypothetical protein